MDTKICGATIVMLARHFEPEVASADWLVEKEILTEKVNNFVHTPVVSATQTDSLNVVVEERRVQIALGSPATADLAMLAQAAERFVRALPDAAYTALGLNYAFAVPRGACDLRLLLAPKTAKLTKVFAEHYELGIIVAFEYKSFRVRLNAPPVGGLPGMSPSDVAIDFNFHRDARSSDEILVGIAQHAEIRAKAEQVVNNLCPSDN